MEKDYSSSYSKYRYGQDQMGDYDNTAGSLDRFQESYPETNYLSATSKGGGKTLSTSSSLPVIKGAFPMNPFNTPFFMQVQMPVAQLDMDWFIRQCKNWDGLFKSNFKNIKYAKEKVYNWIAHFQRLTHIDTFDGPMHWLPWEDQEIFEILKHAIISEEEMINILKRLPEKSIMHKARQAKFKEVSRLRIELERLLVN
jgi:hypothetical protein